MNAAIKAKWSNILTAIVVILTTLQTFITEPPFTSSQVFPWGGILTIAVSLLTIWKQYLSPDVSATGAKVTLVIAIIATLTGVADLVNVLPIPATTGQYIKWGVSVLVAILNVLSKTIFPSYEQNKRMEDLKKQ